MINYIFLTQKHITTINTRKTKKKKDIQNKPVRLYNQNQPIKHIETYAFLVKKHKLNQSEESQDENSVLPILINSLTDDRGQTLFVQNLIANLFETGISPCTTEFTEVKVERQI